MKLDHIFILTEPFAPQASLLSDMGMVEGTRNDHPGQGTANRRFFFSNTALEFLYIRDAAEADGGPGRRLGLPGRATNAGASPFGLVMRGGPGEPMPFDGWDYQPDYFEPGCAFLIGENSGLLAEPLCIHMPFDLARPSDQPRSPHPFTSVTEVILHVPVAEPSAVLDGISRAPSVTVITSAPHLLELVFNDENEVRMRDFRPALPLVIRW